MQKCSKLAWLVEALGCEVGPAFFLKNQPIEFVVPENFEGLPLSVVVGAGEADNAGLTRDLRFDDLIH
jgi:hypothetical protein